MTPAGDGPGRASDQDRDRATVILQQSLADGRLDREEFEVRIDAALSSGSRPELEHLVADLVDVPAPARPPAPLPHGRLVQQHADTPDLPVVVPLVVGAVVSGGAFAAGLSPLIGMAPILLALLVLLVVIGRRR